MSAPSPRRTTSPASPRPHYGLISRLPSFSDADARTNIVHGFSPPTSAGLPPLPEKGTAGSPRPPHLSLHTSSSKFAHLSPQLSTPVDQTFSSILTPEGSPRPVTASPRAFAYADLPPRSRRNSAAIVSISLSSRSRDRTPRGTSVALPPTSSGQATPSKGSSTVTPKAEDSQPVPQKEVMVQMGNSWAPGINDFEDDWRPTGGMLLGSDEEAVEEDDNDDDRNDWAPEEEEEQPAADIFAIGEEFGEGLKFRGEPIEPAVGRLTADSDAGLPLRRGGSEAPKALRGKPGIYHHGRERKVYEVVRQLGSGSYAVVYLVREKGGRRREYALKCLSKQDLTEDQIETQLFEATIHLSLPIHKNIVTLHQTLQTKQWLFLMLELCPGEDLFFWLEKSRDASPPPVNQPLPDHRSAPMSSSKFSASSIPFSSSQLFPGLANMSTSFTNSPNTTFSPNFGASPASLLFAHNNNQHSSPHSGTPPTPSLLSAFSANTLLSTRRLRLIASMFSQMCEAVAVCHDAGVSHRDIKPENFICCDSIELESAQEGEEDFGPQAKRKVVVKLTDFGLATTEEESGDVECGSKPYMSYECRNNLGPTYYPPAADVWSLGIVLINMLFHRNPWKDPAPGDVNFDNFLHDPTGFLLSKFTGIGREVATYLACHVLCAEVEDRVAARDFAKWIKTLPEMIGGRKAVRELKISRLESRAQHNPDKGVFMKSPVVGQKESSHNFSASALTSSAPMLSQLPPPNHLAFQASTIPTPELDTDLADNDIDIKSATTVDDQPTPVDTGTFPSPDTHPHDQDVETNPSEINADEEGRSLSNHKRRKRGVRKGKAAQAALAAAAAGDGPSQEERDSLLKELATASQSLARDLSKHSRPPSELDPTDKYDFPPLGTTPSQAAAAKKSRWKDLMKMSSGNPELAALARRVAERDAASFGNWSAPAQLQHDSSKRSSSMARPKVKHTQTVSQSSGLTSALSSFGPVSSTTSSSGVDDDDWRARPAQKSVPEAPAAAETVKQDDARTRKAQQAAAALTNGLGTMGAFGANRPVIQGQHGHLRTSAPQVPQVISRPVAYTQTSNRSLHPIVDDEALFSKPSTGKEANGPVSIKGQASVSIETASTRHTLSSQSSSSPATTVTTGFHPASPPVGAGPNKPKLKGQIQSLAKMLSGLKTKGKD